MPAKLNIPTRPFTYCTRSDGRYNWCNTGEVQAQYFFRLRADAPNGLHKGYVVDLDHESHYGLSADMPALEIAETILRIFKEKYLFNGRTKDAEALVEYLRTVQEQDEADELDWRVAEAEAQLAYWSEQVMHRKRVVEANKAA